MTSQTYLPPRVTVYVAPSRFHTALGRSSSLKSVILRVDGLHLYSTGTAGSGRVKPSISLSNTAETRIKQQRMADLNPPTITTCLEWLSKDQCAALSVVESALNSNFTTALLGSLAGAFAGAFAAQKMVERSKTREELAKELRNTNAAIMASFTTCNAVLALKRQHVQPLYEKFVQDKKEVNAFHARSAAGQLQGNAQFHFVTDLRTFAAPTTPIDSLKDLLFNKLSVSGRALALVCAIEDAALGLTRSIQARQSLVEQIKSQSIPKDLLALYYFGFTLPNGDINQEYPDLVAAIHSYTDDLAFFSHLLCSDLTAHAHHLQSRLERVQRKHSTKATEVDFSQAKSSGLIPPDDQYTDWLKGFKQPGSGESPRLSACRRIVRRWKTR